MSRRSKNDVEGCFDYLLVAGCAGARGDPARKRTDPAAEGLKAERSEQCYQEQSSKDLTFRLHG
jgi:hypothetical protein